MRLSLSISTFLLFASLALSANPLLDSDPFRKRPNLPLGQMDKCIDNPELSCECLLGDDPSGPTDEERCALGTKKHGMNFPETFTLRQSIFVWDTHFDVETGSEKIGTVTRTPGSTYRFRSESGELLVISNTEYFPMGISAEVFDGAENCIGTLQEQVSSWFSPAKFLIYNSNKTPIAEAIMNFWGTKFFIYDLDNKPIATLMRPWFCFYKHYWTVQIQDRVAFSTHLIDPRLLLMIAVYQTENERYDRKELALEQCSQLPPFQHSNHLSTELKSRLIALSAQIASLDANKEYLSPEEIETDEILVKVFSDADWDLALDETTNHPISYADYRQLQEKARWIQKIKTLEKGLALLEHGELDPERKAALARLLKQFSKETL